MTGAGAWLGCPAPILFRTAELQRSARFVSKARDGPQPISGRTRPDFAFHRPGMVQSVPKETLAPWTGDPAKGESG